MHDECPPYGCGKCVVIDEIDFTDEEYAIMEQAAARVGDSLDVYIHKAIKAGMEAEGW